MAITMPAVTTGYFDAGRHLTRGHGYMGEPLLEEILAAANVDLTDHDARIIILEGITAGMDLKSSCDLCTAGALGAYT